MTLLITILSAFTAAIFITRRVWSVLCVNHRFPLAAKCVQHWSYILDQTKSVSWCILCITLLADQFRSACIKSYIAGYREFASNLFFLFLKRQNEQVVAKRWSVIQLQIASCATFVYRTTDGDSVLNLPKHDGPNNKRETVNSKKLKIFCNEKKIMVNDNTTCRIEMIEVARRTSLNACSATNFTKLKEFTLYKMKCVRQMNALNRKERKIFKSQMSQQMKSHGAKMASIL